MTKYTNTDAGGAFQTFMDPPEWEFYDLESDPREWKNLANRSEVADDLQRLKRVLAAWQNETKDPLLDKDWIARMRKR